MRSWCCRRWGRERGKVRTCAGVVRQAFVPCWLRANALLTRHYWHSSMSGHGRQSIMGAYWWPICDRHWQNMCSTLTCLSGIYLNQGPSCSTQCIIFFIFFCCSGYRGTKSNSITTLEKPMTKAVNNRQELHWNKSFSNPTKVDKKIGAGHPFCLQEGNFYWQML